MARPPARWAVASILLLLELLGTVASTQAKDDISSEQARHPGGNSTGNSTQHTRSLVWPQPYADLPWLAHPSVKLDWEGVTDFEKLARLRHDTKRKAVTITMHSKATSRMTLNLIYSLVIYGHVDSYMVACVDEQAMADCQSWRLPCFNASWALQANPPRENPDGPALFEQKYYFELVWSKLWIVSKALDLGYAVHWTDADVLYLHPVYQSYEIILQETHADGVFTNESPINGGVFYLVNNNRNKALMQAWRERRAPDPNQLDQHQFGKLENKAVFFCVAAEDCVKNEERNQSSIFRVLGNQFWTHCPLIHIPYQFYCHPDRLYFHIMCLGWGGKGKWLTQNKLWFVNVYGQPLWWEGRTQAARNHHANVTVNGMKLARHPFMPCHGLAWEYMRQGREWVTRHAPAHHHQQDGAGKQNRRLLLQSVLQSVP